VLQDFELDLLNLRQPLPLRVDQVIHLFVQIVVFQFGFKIDPLVVLRTQALLRFLPLQAHHDDRRFDRGQA